jgi:hypothetical protein
MKREKKKAPADYPLFAFRISETDKDRLNKLIEEIQELYNAERAHDEKHINKNDVIVAALDKGLALLKRGKLK